MTGIRVHNPFGTRCFMFVLLAAAMLMAAGPAGFSAWASDQSAESDPLRVLFIGNSLTYQNRLPQLVASLGHSEGIDIHTESVALPDHSLEDHWRRGRARAVLTGGQWDVVVLQQGPSSTDENRKHLETWSQRWSTLIRKQGARPALYMVWPSENRRGDFARVVKSYSEAAKSANAELLPVGIAWLLAIHSAPDLEIYGSDRFHPSSAGTLLSAMVIYTGISGSELRRLPPDLELPGNDLQTLRSLALRALAESEDPP